MFIRFLSAGIAVSCFLVSQAYANEIRLGVLQHDVEVSSLGGQKGKEASMSVSAEFVGQPIEALSFIRSPRPYVGGLLNVNDETSSANAGLSWRGKVTKRSFVDYAIGMAVHNGALIIPSPNNETDPEVISNIVNRKANEIEFGSRFLIRNAFSIGYNLTEETSVELVWEHMSNGAFFDDVNEGIDNIGIRYGRKF